MNAAQMAHVNSESCQKIAFLDLWYIFKPGNEVISSARDQLYRGNRVIGALHNPSYPDHDNGFWAQPSVFQVKCVHMDYNGKIFGPVTEIFDIEKYRGERDITSLRIYPVRYSKDPAQGATGVIGLRLDVYGCGLGVLQRRHHQRSRGSGWPSDD